MSSGSVTSHKEMHFISLKYSTGSGYFFGQRGGWGGIMGSVWWGEECVHKRVEIEIGRV